MYHIFFERIHVSYIYTTTEENSQLGIMEPHHTAKYLMYKVPSQVKWAGGSIRKDIECMDHSKATTKLCVGYLN